MKIAVFVYDFEHAKSYDGLVRLWIENIPVQIIVAAPWVALKSKRCTKRMTPKDVHTPHPKHVATRMNIPYRVVPHNSLECCQMLQNADIDLGVILGARILAKRVITACKGRILNLHPGMLPQNRGLETIPWAIKRCEPQGVTAHLIDPCIDGGRLVIQKAITVYVDDTLLDLHIRIHALSIELMVESIRYLAEHDPPDSRLDTHAYNPAFTDECATELDNAFEVYKHWLCHAE